MIAAQEYYYNELSLLPLQESGQKVIPVLRGKNEIDQVQHDCLSV